ncbi:MAG: hypothetical protein ABH828_03335 [archaeon]
MTDIVVSVRMPSSLVRELKILADSNHFKDLSEEIRSVVREQCMKYGSPYIPEIQKLREELVEKKESDSKQHLIAEMKKILDELKNGS